MSLLSQWLKVSFICRLKCGEFLLLLIGHVNGRRDQAPLATIHDDLSQLLGEKSASLIWAASQFGSTLDPEQRQTALHIQARRVLESIELYWCEVTNDSSARDDCKLLSSETGILFSLISCAQRHKRWSFLHSAYRFSISLPAFSSSCVQLKTQFNIYFTL